MKFNVRANWRPEKWHFHTSMAMRLVVFHA